MMAFFLLLWILGATTEKQRKSIADYFAPTLVELRENSAGSNGLLGGESIVDRANYPPTATQPATRQLTVPFRAGGRPESGRGPGGPSKKPPPQAPRAGEE